LWYIVQLKLHIYWRFSLQHEHLYVGVCIAHRQYFCGTNSFFSLLSVQYNACQPVPFYFVTKYYKKKGNTGNDIITQKRLEKDERGTVLSAEFEGSMMLMNPSI